MAYQSGSTLSRIERRKRVAELYLQGFTQTQIGSQFGVNQSTICFDLKCIRKEWRKSTIRDFDDAKAIELQKIDQLEREAWKAWDRSQKPQQTAVINGQGSGERSKKTIVNQYGDPRFLEVVHKCIAQRRAILGLDALPPSEGPATHDESAPALHRTRIFAVLGELQQHRPVGEVVQGIGPLQPRLNGPGE